MNEQDHQKQERKRVEVPPGNPFVRDSSRIQAQRRREHLVDDREKRRERLSSAWNRDPVKLAQARRRSLFLSWMFFGVALIIFFVVRFTAPKILVQTDGIPGQVMLNGEKVGSAHKLIRQLPPGYHIVRFIPDNSAYSVEPDSVPVDLVYGLEVEKIKFTLSLSPATPLDTATEISTSETTE